MHRLEHNMIAEHPPPASFDHVSGIKDDHSCCGDEQHIAAERELSALVKAARILFGDAEADRVAEDWIEFAENWGLPLVDGHPQWRRLTAAAIQRLAERRCPRRELRHKEE
jgi:hypothetical protein